MSYQEFLSQKQITDRDTGLETIPDLNPMLFPFQHDIVSWALRRGRASIFADCGMGKTPMQLEWAHHVPGNVLILAPLAVSKQTIREAQKFGIPDIGYSPDGSIQGKITITNYERFHHFDMSQFNGIVLDESSILKSYTGKYRTEIIEGCQHIPFRLACTATPAPNDFMELGNHAEFMGAMTRTEMLSMFFVHDGGETQKWRLKGHAEDKYWEWVCSWAVMIRKPSDLGYEDNGFILPALNVEQITIPVKEATSGMLFAMEARSLIERRQARKDTTRRRCEKAAEMVNSSDKQWIVWCDLNRESELLANLINDAVEVKGSDTQGHKEDSMLGFSDGSVRVLVTKPKIAGFGMNWQNCHNVIFVGLSDSYEQYYQAIRRCWRFGQKNRVNCYIVTASTEGAVVANIERKERDALKMAEMMVENMHSINEQNIKGTTRTRSDYHTDLETGLGWEYYLKDCVEGMADVETDSVGYTIFSPPFASLYTYSNSDRDMGNCKDDNAFAEHFAFLIPELFRVTMPGRLLSFHCMNLPTSKTRDGFIGIKDFRGQLIRMFEDAGFIYHSEVVIWKNPVTAMQRTKALGLLHKQIVKDSAMSRQGIPDYLVTMRKPGENPKPIEGELDHFIGEDFTPTGRLSIDIWQRYASPVWMDINPSRTLQKQEAREDEDERHICPLQLDVIERGLQLWSMPGDLVLSPFGGIASEGYCAVKSGRRFIGFELKRSYWEQGVKNLRVAEHEAASGTLFDGLEV